MKIKFLYLGLVGLIPTNGLAGLQVDVNSSPGTFCYSEANYNGDPILIHCGPAEMYGNDLSYFEGDCPESYEDFMNEHTGTCYLGIRNGYVVACDWLDTNSHVCDYCDVPGVGKAIIDWTDYGSNRVFSTVVSSATVLTDDVAPNTDWTCDVDFDTSDKYGCAAGYYASSGSGSSIACSRCPSSGGVYGTNSIGSTDITTCYIPYGTNFSDDTGSGTYTGTCYYSN